MLLALHAHKVCQIWSAPEASSGLQVAKQQQPAAGHRWEDIKNCAQATAWPSRSANGFCNFAEAAAALLLQAVVPNPRRDSPSCRVEMNHGQGKAVNEFLFAMLKMIFDAYLQSMMPRNEVNCAQITGITLQLHSQGQEPTRPAPGLQS